jgi:hypothetical protein
MKTEDNQGANISDNNNNNIELLQFSMKARLSEYNPLKNDREWRAWARHVLVMAASHGCDSVLELSKLPITLGDLQDKFMFSMFAAKLLTSKGIVAKTTSQQGCPCTLAVPRKSISSACGNGH